MQKNIADFRDKLFFHPNNVYDLPDYYELEPTRGCNLKCRMCHVSFMKDPVTYLDLDAIKDFSFLKGKTVSIGAVFEPCIHPHINKLIDILNHCCPVNFHSKAI